MKRKEFLTIKVRKIFKAATVTCHPFLEVAIAVLLKLKVQMMILEVDGELFL